MVKKKVWDKPNPKMKSKTLTASQKAGRPYPNLIDNMAASRGKKK